MKNLIRKILKEELSDDDLNWIQEIDPIDTFKNGLNHKAQDMEFDSGYI